jgi:glycosyltransferase involved in cell wall biosynthesis
MPDAITGIIRRITAVRFKHVLTVHSTNEGRSRIRTIMAGGGNVVYCSQAAKKLSRPLVSVSNAVIPNGIVQSSYSTACAQRSQTRRLLGVPEDAFVVILVGRMCAQKNFDLALDAIAALNRRVPKRDFCVLFCGDGEWKERLEARANALSLTPGVRFLGSRTDVSALLGASDLFLSTSVYEGMPLTVLEALTTGLPCVLTSIDEHVEIAGIMPGCKFAPLKDAEKMASALGCMMDKRLSLSALKSARAPFLGKFSIDHCADSYLSLYDSLCNL